MDLGHRRAWLRGQSARHVSRGWHEPERHDLVRDLVPHAGHRLGKAFERRYVLPVGTGGERLLTGDDDYWFSPYQYADVAQRNAGFQAYLDWEVNLVEQLGREN